MTTIPGERAAWAFWLFLLLSCLFTGGLILFQRSSWIVSLLLLGFLVTSALIIFHGSSWPFGLFVLLSLLLAGGFIIFKGTSWPVWVFLLLSFLLSGCLIIFRRPSWPVWLLLLGLLLGSGRIILQLVYAWPSLYSVEGHYCGMCGRPAEHSVGYTDGSVHWYCSAHQSSAPSKILRPADEPPDRSGIDSPLVRFLGQAGGFALSAWVIARKKEGRLRYPPWMYCACGAFLLVAWPRYWFPPWFSILAAMVPCGLLGVVCWRYVHSGCAED